MSGAISGNPSAPKETTGADLYYKNPNLSGDAGQTTTLTVIGGSEEPLSPDQVIVVNVPLDNLKDALVYQSNWVAPQDGQSTAGIQPYPKCALQAQQLIAAATKDAGQLTAEGRFLSFLARDDLTTSEPKFTDDSGDNSLWTMQSYFMNTRFAYSNASGPASVIEQIPAESVSSVVANAPEVDGLAMILGTDATSDGAAPDVNSPDYVLDLFQQAEAAGKIKYATPPTTVGGAATPNAAASTKAGYSRTDFAVGDSLTIYVTYNLTKTKEIDLENIDRASFKLTASDGTVHTFTGSETAASDVVPVQIAWQFVASA